jgi:hypothetical protein
VVKSESLLYALGNIADNYIAEAEPKTAKLARLWQKPLILAAAIALFLLLCAFTVYAVLRYFIAFPANEAGKSGYSLHIFDTAFVLSVDLPAGVTIDADPVAAPDVISGAFSTVALINASGDIVGYLGYNIYDMEQLAEIAADEFNPLMIYNQIGLGAHYRFTVREKYNVVNDTEALTTAITDVYNDMALAPPDRMNYTEDDYNYGIVSYSKTLPVYVAFDLSRDAFTPEQIAAMAGSVAFAASEDTSR